MDNRRKTIVINKKFQYQYSLLIAALAVLLVNGFLLARMAFPGDNPLTLTTGGSLGIAAVEMFLIGSIWYGSLIASHRIAGPVYVFTREVCKLGTGDLSANIHLRDKDMFQPEAEQMNSSIAALSLKIKGVQGLLQNLEDALSQDQDPSKILQQLSAELSAFKTEIET